MDYSNYTSLQIQSIDPSEISGIALNSFTPSQLNSFTPSQLNILSVNQIQSLSQSQLSYYTAFQGPLIYDTFITASSSSNKVPYTQYIGLVPSNANLYIVRANVTRSSLALNPLTNLTSGLSGSSDSFFLYLNFNNTTNTNITYKIYNYIYISYLFNIRTEFI